MSASENGVVKQLRAVIEEDRRVIRKLREEVDRLRFLLGLHSLQKTDSESALGRPPHSRSTQLRPGFLN
jgi:hypothetical protein